MENNNTLKRKIFFIFLSGLLISLSFTSCKRDRRLDKLIIHENPFIGIKSKPEVLLDKLDNPIAPVFIGQRIVFVESGKGVIYEYKNNKIVPLINGFKLDDYARYKISVLGITPVPGTTAWIIAAAQDSGHILMFDESTFPTTAEKGREIQMLRTESSNPFSTIFLNKGAIIVATGGTKSVYQGKFDLIDPGPLKPVFDVPSGVEGMVEDPITGNVFGAVVGTGQKDGSLIRWDPQSDSIQTHEVAKGFSNLVGVLMLPNRKLLLLEFGSFDTEAGGSISVIDPEKPEKVYPLISGLNFPSGFTLDSNNILLVSTFSKDQSDVNGMLVKIRLNIKNVSGQ
jgi:hypothetical protein